MKSHNYEVCTRLCSYYLDSKSSLPSCGSGKLCLTESFTLSCLIDIFKFSLSLTKASSLFCKSVRRISATSKQPSKNLLCLLLHKTCNYRVLQFDFISPRREHGRSCKHMDVKEVMDLIAGHESSRISTYLKTLYSSAVVRGLLSHNAPSLTSNVTAKR